MLKKILTLSIGLGMFQTTLFAEKPAYTVPKTPLVFVIQQDDVLSEIISAIPSPAEIAELIKGLDSEYPRNSMRSTSSIQLYNGDAYKQALNLGVYSTDLGFASIFKKNTDALKYLDAVKDLSKALNIGNFFDSKAIQESKEAIDKGTITDFATRKIDEISNYLVEKNRQHVAALMLAGGWIEAIHISLKVYEKSNNPKLREAVGEQKFVLEQLLQIFNIYGKANHQTLIKQLKNLKTAYDKVQIETVYGASTTKVNEKGELIVTDGSYTVVKITEAHLKEIETIIEDIRADIIK